MSAWVRGIAASMAGTASLTALLAVCFCPQPAAASEHGCCAPETGIAARVITCCAGEMVRPTVLVGPAASGTAPILADAVPLVWEGAAATPTFRTSTFLTPSPPRVLRI